MKIRELMESTSVLGSEVVLLSTILEIDRLKADKADIEQKLRDANAKHFDAMTEFAARRIIEVKDELKRREAETAVEVEPART